MDERVQEIERIIEQAEAEAQKLLNDTKYSESYRAEKARNAKQSAYKAAVAIAQSLITEVDEKVREAERRYTKSIKAHRESLDPQRQTLAYQQVQALASAGNWEEIRSAIAEAERLEDTYALQAWRDVGTYILRSRARERFGPLAGRGGEAESLRNRLSEMLDALQPESVRVARKQLEDALRAQQESLRRIVALNQRYSLRTGGPGPLAELFNESQTVVERNPETGNMVFTKRGGGFW